MKKRQCQKCGEVHVIGQHHVCTAAAAGFTVAAKDNISILFDANISVADGEKIADIGRRRTQAEVEASAFGSAVSIGSLYGLIQQAQESDAAVAAGYLTIYKVDGSTSLGTKVLGTNVSAVPVDKIS